MESSVCFGGSWSSLPRMVSVRTMLFMILSQKPPPHEDSWGFSMGSRWLSCILTSTCFCMLLALKQGGGKSSQLVGKAIGRAPAIWYYNDFWVLLRFCKYCNTILHIFHLLCDLTYKLGFGFYKVYCVRHCFLNGLCQNGQNTGDANKLWVNVLAPSVGWYHWFASICFQDYFHISG